MLFRHPPVAFSLSKGSHRGCATHLPFVFGDVGRLSRTALASSCRRTAPIRAIALTVKASLAEEEPSSAFLTSDCPDPNSHGLAQAEMETGRGPSYVRRTTRRPRPRGDTGGLGGRRSGPPPLDCNYWLSASVEFPHFLASTLSGTLEPFREQRKGTS